VRALLVLTLVALLPACGADGCEIPVLVVEPSEVRTGEEVEVRPDGSLSPCHDERTDTLFRPVPADTFELHVMLVPVRTRTDGTTLREGEPVTWGTVGYDEEIGDFTFKRPLPNGLPPGDYNVYLHEQPESSGKLRIPLSGPG